MEPWQSWAAFIALAAGCVFYYSSRGAAGRNRGRPIQRVNDTLTRVKDDSKKKLVGEGASKPPKKANKQKNLRKADKKPASDGAEKVPVHTSTNSSTTSAEGEDDLSPVSSPVRNATAAKAPNGRDVSDMLEPKAAPASVLRLTEPTQPVRQKQAHQPRPEASQETKKQRQNKKKVEERKLQREQEEKERQALLEKQRRTAREARGEPAKNGLQQAKAPTSNAWSLPKGTSNTVGSMVAANNGGPLLDTFDQDAVSITSSSEGATNGTSATTDDVANDDPWTSGMTEEEQIRLAMADSEWTTVPKGRKAKKPKVASTEGSDAGLVSPELPIEKMTAKPIEKTAEKSISTSSPATPKVQSKTSAEAAAQYASSHPLDSDWPVV